MACRGTNLLFFLHGLLLRSHPKMGRARKTINPFGISGLGAEIQTRSLLNTQERTALHCVTHAPARTRASTRARTHTRTHTHTHTHTHSTGSQTVRRAPLQGRCWSSEGARVVFMRYILIFNQIWAQDNIRICVFW
jgi:hypothetical protein